MKVLQQDAYGVAPCWRHVDIWRHVGAQNSAISGAIPPK